MERRTRHILSAALVLLLAGCVRFYQLNWDSMQILNSTATFSVPLIAHPDERGFLTRVQKLGVEGWNPKTYGPLPLYLIKFASLAAARMIDPAWAEYRHTALVGRFLSACFGWGAVLATLLLGKRLHSIGAGVFGAFLLATNVLHIQASHFAAPDTFLTCFVQLTLLLGILSLQKQDLASIFICGVSAGLAVASKFNGIGLLPVVIAAGYWNPSRAKAITAGLAGMLAAFFLGAPFAFLDPATFWGRIAIEQGRVFGSSMPWNIQQYIPTTPLLYPLEQMVVWGFGLPAGLFVVTALIWAIGAAWHGDGSPEAGTLRRPLLLILLWLVPGFILTAFSQVRLPRYLLPFYPQLCLLGALMTAILVAKKSVMRTAVIVFAGVACAGSFLWMLAFLNIYSSPHPYLQSTSWAHKNVAQDSKILLEQMNEEVPMNVQNRFRLGVHLPVFRLPDSTEKTEFYARALSLADYLSLPNLAVAGTILTLDAPHSGHPDISYPYGAAMYRLLFSGQLGYTVVQEFSRYPALMGWEINDDPVDLKERRPRYRCDQSFSLYDHPHSILFRNTGRLSEQEIYSRILKEAKTEP